MKGLEILKDIFKDNPEIIDQEQEIKTEEEQNKVLQIIVTKIIFDIKQEEIINQCKYIFKEYKYPINDTSELFTKEAILALLNILFNKTIPQVTSINSKEFDEKIFQFKLNEKYITIFIDSTFFNEQCYFLILVQIYLLLNHYRQNIENPIFKVFSCVLNKMEDTVYKSTEAFFDDGIHFPKLISLLLNNEVSIIPPYFNNQQNTSQNNRIAIEFLCKKIPGLDIDKNYLLETTENKIYILKAILFTLFFCIDEKKVMEQCQNITGTLDIKLTKLSFIKLILNFHKTNNYNNIDNLINNFDLFINSVKNKEPLFITSSFFEKQYDFLLIIQVFLILKAHNKIDENPIMLLFTSFLDNKYSHWINFTDKFILESGYHFPQLISVLFNKGKSVIPTNFLTGEKKDVGKYNLMVIQYLRSYKPDAIKIFENNKNSNILFEIIITKFMFNIIPEKIFNECKKIFDQYQIQLHNFYDVLSKKSVLSLIYIAFYRKVPPEQSVNPENFDKLILDFKNEKKFDKIFINSSFYKKEYKFLILVQIYVILIYIHHQNNNQELSVEILEEDEDEDETKSDESNEEEEYIENSQQNESSDDDDNDTDFSENQNEIELITRKNHNESIEFEEKIEEILLKAVNECTDNEFHFNNFYQAAKNDSIPKFVMRMFNIKRIKNVQFKMKKKYHKGYKLTPLELKNIDAVICYLTKKEPKFDVLLFNFNNERLIESSSILFYMNFMNFFFVKKNKKDLINRSIILLKMKEINEDKLLTNFDTYYTLANFINYPKKTKGIFQEQKIPILFDQQFLDLCSSYNKIPDVLYYQLQFIFNKIDENYSRTKVIESLLTGRYILQKVNSLQLYNILEIVKAKNLSNISAVKRRNSIEKKINYLEPTVSYPIFKMSSNKYPSKFKERLEIYALPDNETKINRMRRGMKSSPAEKYWNSFPKINYSIENGILYNKEIYDRRSEELENLWITDMNHIQKNIILEKDEKKEKRKEKKSHYEPIIIKDKKQKPFKLFIYDENESNWKFIKDSFVAFSKLNSLNSHNIKTPLILLFNSYESDLIAINSKFITKTLPDLDENCDEQIYVYGFCDNLNYHIDEKDNYDIKPIFLLLHVPQNKQNHPEINKIIVQIYSFLSYISDIKIVVLNKNHYKDQIEMIELLDNMYSKVNENSIPSNESIIFDKSNNDNDDDDIFMNEYDEDNYNEEEEEEEEYNIKLSFIKSSSINLSNNTLKRKSKFIILVNDPSIKYDQHLDEYLNQYFYIQDILELNYIFRFHLIDLNKLETYTSFLSSMKEFIVENKTMSDDVLKNFEFVQMSEITNTYIQIKGKNSWKKDLEKLIIDRYSILKSSTIDSSLQIAARIGEELSLISTPFDCEFSHECNRILSNIEKDDDEKRITISEELKFSSEKHFDELCWIDDHVFLNENKYNLFIQSHINLLKEEYCDILKYIYPLKKLGMFYENNIDILNEQIKNDLIKFSNAQKEVKERYEKYNEKEDLMNLVYGSTNYQIKQQEKFKEIKVTVKLNGDLKDEVPQDF